MSETREETTWSVLRFEPFRAVWIADFVSNLGFFAQSVGAAWLMTSLTKNACLVSLVQTASTLPVFLAAIPAGVIADLIDRRGLIRKMNLVLAVLAGVLALLTIRSAVTPTVLLVGVFVMGLADAMQQPAFAALVPEIVPLAKVPSAVALFGINFNISRVVSPPLAGLLIAIAGPALSFAANAASFVPILCVMQPRVGPVWPNTSTIREGIARTLGLAQESSTVRDVLLHSAAFSVCASAIFALLPLYARVHLHANASQFGLLFAALGGGSVAVAQVLAHLQRRYGASNTILLGTVTLGACFVALGNARSLTVACTALFAAGFGWLTVLSTLNTAIQFAVPSEHRAAGFSLYLVTSQGVFAFGSVLWGALATQIDSARALIVSGILFVVLGAAARYVPLPWRT
jgi:MFS family permease